MRAFWKQCRGLHIWLVCLAAFLAAFALLRRDCAVMDGFCRRVLLPWEQGIGRLCSHLSISVAEMLILTLLMATFFALTWWVRRLIATRFDGLVFYRGVLLAVCTALTVWAGFRLLWTPFYQAESFQEKSGIVAVGGTVAELQALTMRFAEELSACADEVLRDENGCFAVPRREILDAAAGSYDVLVEEFPFLKMEDHAPKAFAASRALSRLNFTGFYFPFTGESNVNIDSPAVFLGATVCHEMAHQRGIASEQECNFLGILAAVRSDKAAYRYSGYLTGYLYLANALYRVDEAAWREIRESLPDEVICDLQVNNRYWAQFEGPVKETAQTVYDGFLKANGDANGIRSYGMVVDLLLAYYG